MLLTEINKLVALCETEINSAQSFNSLKCNIFYKFRQLYSR